MNKKKLCLLITIALTFLFEKPLSAQEMKQKDTGIKPELISGIWNCNDGGKYYVRIDGNDCYWFGESDDDGASWVNIFIGKIEGVQIKGMWFDLPKGKNRGKGDLVLDIAPDMKAFNFVDGTGGFSGRQWKKTEASSAIRRRSVPIPKKQEDIVKEVEPKEAKEKYQGHLSPTYSFLGHTYELSSQKKNWQMAKRDANKRDGHLVVINSSEEQKFIEKILADAEKTQNFSEPVWIGFTDERSEGDWKWVNGDKVAFTFWPPQQPSNTNGITPENYAVLWPRKETQFTCDKYQWNDVAGDNQLRYLIEYDEEVATNSPKTFKIRTTR